MDDTLIKELTRLNKNEKIILAEALWDSIAAHPNQVNTPEHHKNILEKRLQTLDQDVLNGKTWDDIKSKYL